MSQQDELYRVVLETIGKDGIKDLKEELGYTKAALEQLKGAYSRGEVETEKFLQAADRLTRQETKMEAVIRGVERAQQAQATAAGAAAGATEAATNRIAAGAGNAANRVQVLGQTLDDLQYVPEQGLRPILNNIMQISPAVGIALLAFDFMRRAFNAFTGDTKEAANEVERLKKQVEELEKKPHKITLDLDNLAAAEGKLSELEKRLAAFEANRQTAQEADLAKQAADVAKNYGGSPALIKAVMEGETASGVTHGTGADEEALRKAKGKLDWHLKAAGGEDSFTKMYRSQIDQLQAKIRADTESWARQEVGAFETGDEGAIKRMKNRVAQAPGRFTAVGPRGIDAAEAITDLPSTAAEAQERADAERRQKAAIAMDRERQEREEKAAKAAHDEAIKAGREALKRAEGGLQYGRREQAARGKAAAGTGGAIADAAADAARQSLEADRARQKVADKAKQDYAAAHQKSVERLGSEQAVGVRNQLAGQIQQSRTGLSLGQSYQAAEQAMQLSAQGVNLQEATLAVVRRMQAENARLKARMDAMAGQLRLMNGNGGGSQVAYPYAQAR